MKKTFALILSLAMLLSVFAGTPALAQSAYVPGTYTGTGYGNNDKITVEVTLSENAIESIRIVEEDETYYMFEYVVDAIPGAIIENQSLAVDVVSGASNSSRGVINAVKDAITQAGGDIEALSQPLPEVEKTQREMTTDILVVGAGASGMSAANRALQNGKNVLLLEQLDVVGGNARFAGGTFMLGATEEERQTMKDYLDTRMYYADFPSAEGTPNMKRIYENVDATKKVYDMFEDIDMAFENWDIYGSYVYAGSMPEKYADDLADYTGYLWKGSFLCEQLQAAYESAGGVLMTGTQATDLIMADGKVVGAKAVSDTEELTIYADTVILATGSYSRNNDMLAQYIPTSDGDFFCTTVGDNGTGIQMALKAGGVMTTDNYINGGARVCLPATAMQTHGHAYSSSDVISGGIIVALDGERRTNEGDDRYFRYYGEEGLDSFFTMCDAEILEAAGKTALFEEKASAKGPYYKADTLEELAQLTGMNFETLKASVESYNHYALTGEDPFAHVAGISTAGASIDDLKENSDKEEETVVVDTGRSPIDEGPYYAAKLTFVGFDLIGGLKTGDHGEVLTAAGEEIPGLYAVGFASSRDFEGSGASHHYCLMLCLTTGLLAVDDACAL